MKLQLKRSNVLQSGEAKSPTSEQLDYGELAVNYNNGDPAVFLKDSNDTVIRIAGRGATGLDGDYVNITGDNMTGDLTLGDISTAGAKAYAGGYFTIANTADFGQAFGLLDTTNNQTAVKMEMDGSATFKGDITSELNANYKSVVAPNGTIALYGGGNLATYLQNDGSATFAGTVISGGNPANGAARGTSINEYGTVRAANASGSIFEGYTAGTAAATSQIYASGAATFKSQLSSGNVAGSGYRQGFLCVPDGDGSYVQVYGKNGDVTPTFSVYNGDLSDNVATISSAGSATFAGDVTVGDYQSGTAGKNGFQFRSSGELVQNRNGGDAYTLYNNSATKTVTISAAGAATFAGNVKSDSYYESARTGSATASAFYATLDGVQGVDIKASGAATFKGDVESNGYLWANGSSSFIVVSRTGATGNTTVAEFGGSTATSRISADGGATFDGNVQQGLKTASDPGNLIYAAGGYYSRFAAGDTTSAALQIKNGTADAAVILANGAATFAGPVTVKQDLSSSFGSPAFEVSNATQDQVIRLNNNGSASFASTQAAFTSNGSLYFREGGGASPGSNKAFIDASDGTADFAGGLIKLKVDGSVKAAGYSMASLAQL